MNLLGAESQETRKEGTMAKLELPKYQAKVFKAYADKLDEKTEKRFKEAIESNPELKEFATAAKDPLADALRKGAVEFCKYFYREDECKSDNRFADEKKKEESEAVRLTVEANLRAYNAIKRAIQNEKQPDYISIYNALIGNYEKYFSITAESTMNHSYHDYRSFAADFRAKEEAKQKDAAAKRKVASADE